MFLDQVFIYFTLSEVGLADVDYLIKELYCHGCIDIAFGGCQDNDIFLLNVDETGPVDINDRRLFVLFRRDLFRAELHCLHSCYVVFVHSVNQDLSFLVYKYY